jgi:hypothetical protein
MKIISGGVYIGSEKLYTQKEVNALMEKQNPKVPFPAEKIEDEGRKLDEQKRSNTRSVAKLVEQSNRILVSISSHAFPIDLFPDTVNVEEGRITIIKRHFLASEVHSVDIKDISNVFINTSIFFSQLVIISRTFEDNEIRVRNLHPKDAIFARRIIEGLRVFASKSIDTSGFSQNELVAKLEELSTTKTVV